MSRHTNETYWQNSKKKKINKNKNKTIVRLKLFPASESIFNEIETTKREFVKLCGFRDKRTIRRKAKKSAKRRILLLYVFVYFILTASEESLNVLSANSTLNCLGKLKIIAINWQSIIVTFDADIEPKIHLQFVILSRMPINFRLLKKFGTSRNKRRQRQWRNSLNGREKRNQSFNENRNFRSKQTTE